MMILNSENVTRTFTSCPSYHENSVACAKIKEFLCENSSTDSKVVNQYLNGRIQANKYEIENRDCSNLLKSVFGFLRLSGFRHKYEDLKIFNRVAIGK